jgi:hypothetical protein
MPPLAALATWVSRIVPISVDKAPCRSWKVNACVPLGAAPDTVLTTWAWPRWILIKVQVIVWPAPRVMAEGASLLSQVALVRSHPATRVSATEYALGTSAPLSLSAAASVRLKPAYPLPVVVKSKLCSDADGFVTLSTMISPRCWLVRVQQNVRPASAG